MAVKDLAESILMQNLRCRPCLLEPPVLLSCAYMSCLCYSALFSLRMLYAACLCNALLSRLLFHKLIVFEWSKFKRAPTQEIWMQII